jgi:hypothetical protein
MPPYARDNGGVPGYGDAGSHAPPQNAGIPGPTSSGNPNNGPSPENATGDEDATDGKPVLKCSAGPLGAEQGGSFGLLALLGLSTVILHRRRSKR